MDARFQELLLPFAPTLPVPRIPRQHVRRLSLSSAIQLWPFPKQIPLPATIKGISSFGPPPASIPFRSAERVSPSTTSPPRSTAIPQTVAPEEVAEEVHREVR